MSFVSFEFLLFFGAFAPLYFVVQSNRLQNLLILAGSYIFYAAWDWRFLSLIYFVSVTNYAAARIIASGREHWRKPALNLAIVFSLGVLA